MERLNSKQWINDLKIAIINNDIEKMKIYSKREVPEFSSIEEALEAKSLINKIIENIGLKKTQVSQKMQILKQTKKYSNAYSNNSTNNWKA